MMKCDPVTGVCVLPEPDKRVDGAAVVAKRGWAVRYIGDPMCSWCWGISPTVDEVEAFHQARRAERRNARFAAMDVDKNGSVSVAEFTAAHAERLTWMDSNKDGVLDANDRGHGQGRGHGHGYGHEQN